MKRHNPVVTRNNVASFFVGDVLDIGECGDSDDKSTQEVNKDMMVDDELCVYSRFVFLEFVLYAYSEYNVLGVLEYRSTSTIVPVNVICAHMIRDMFHTQIVVQRTIVCGTQYLVLKYAFTCCAVRTERHHRRHIIQYNVHVDRASSTHTQQQLQPTLHGWCTSEVVLWEISLTRGK